MRWRLLKNKDTWCEEGDSDDVCTARYVYYEIGGASA